MCWFYLVVALLSGRVCDLCWFRFCGCLGMLVGFGCLGGWVACIGVLWWALLYCAGFTVRLVLIVLVGLFLFVLYTMCYGCGLTVCLLLCGG